MKKVYLFQSSDFFAICFLLLVVAAFYWQTIVRGLLPVPTDTLIGLYHPWRDLYVSTNPNGVAYKNFLITDPVRQQIPWRKLSIDSWKKGTVPGWDSTSFTGSPLGLNIQSGAWYPLNVLFFAFPFQIAWTLLVISQTLGMVMFTYLFLRRQTVSPFASVAGAVIAGFMGFSISWLTWGTIVSSFMWLPLMLLCIDGHETGTTTKKQILFGLLLAFALFSTITAGHTQLAVYTIGVSVLYALWRSITSKSNRPIGSTLLIFALVGLALSPYLVRYWSLIQSTLRVAGGSDYLSEGFFIPVQHLIQFLIPDFFGNPATLNYFGTWNYGELVGYAGSAGLMLATFGIFSKHTSRWFWFGLLGLSLLFSVDSPIARLPYILHLPIISSLQPTRLLSIAGLSLAVLSAFGCEVIFGKETNYATVRKILAAYFSLWISIFIAERLSMKTDLLQHLLVSSRNTYFPFGIAAVSMVLVAIASHPTVKRNSVVTGLFQTGLILLIIVDLFRFGWKFTPFTPAAYFFPETKLITYINTLPKPNRIITLSSDIVPANTLGYYGIETVGGYNPIYTKRYARFVSTMESGISSDKLTFQRILEPANINSPLFRFLSASYIAARASLDPMKYEVVESEGQTTLYKVQSALNRFYIADSVHVLGKDSEVLDSMLHDEGTGRPVYTTNTIQEESGVSGSAIVDSYAPDRQSITVTSNGDTMLVNATAFDPGWHAYVDDKEVPVLNANYLFMGVPVTSGKHIVRFEYR